MVDLSVVEAIVSNFGFSPTHEHRQVVSVCTPLQHRAEFVELSQFVDQRDVDGPTEYHLHDLLSIFRNLLVAATDLSNGLLQEHWIDFVFSSGANEDGMISMGWDVVVYHDIPNVAVFEQSASIYFYLNS